MLRSCKLMTVSQNSRSSALSKRTIALLNNYIRTIIQRNSRENSRQLSTTKSSSTSSVKDKCACDAADVMKATMHKPSGTHRLSGAVRECPDTKRFFLLKAIVVVIPFLFLGGMASKRGAKLLQDYEIFIPEEDDF